MDFICDIDGTLADVEHRRHFVSTKPRNWPAFWAAADGDTPIVPVVETVKALMFAGHRMVLSSGRQEQERAQTSAWLLKHCGIHVFNDRVDAIMFKPQVEMFMRHTGDNRPDYVVKEEMLEFMHRRGYNPALAIDDRQQVVDMWRKNGIRCAQVDVGDF